jgi:HEAT repeat protein
VGEDRQGEEASMAGVIALFLATATQAAEDSPDVIRRLIQNLRSEQPLEREDARRRLKGLGRKAAPELEKAARDGDPEVVAAAQSLLRALSLAEKLPAKLRKEVPGVEYRLAEGRRAWTVVFLELATELPGDLDFEDLECLAPSALREANPGAERTDVIEYIGSHEYRSAVPELLKLLGDRDARKEAAWTLAILQAREAVGPIIGMLQDEDETAVVRAMECLWVLGGREAFPELRKFLKHEDWFLVAKAANTLCSLGDTESAPTIIKLLHHEEAFVRLEVARAVGYLHDDSAVPGLVPLLQDKDPLMRQAAARSLGTLKAKSAAPDLLARLKDEDPMVRSAACSSLAGLDSKLVAPAFVELLRDPDVQVRLAALAGLEMLQAAEHVDRIVPLLQDKDDMVLHAALRCLCALGSREAVPVILAGGGNKFRLSTLNVLRAPRRTKELSDAVLPGNPEGTIAELIERLSKATRGAVELPPIDPARSQWRIKIHPDGGRVTLYDAWDHIAVKLSGTGAVDLIVEEERLRILPRREALADWTAWHQRKK